MTDNQQNKTERVQLLMTPTELSAIDDWGFSNRIRTRAETIRRLCQIGIRTLEERETLLRNRDAATDELIAFLERYADAQESGRETDPFELDLMKLIRASTQGAIHTAGFAEMIAALSQGDSLEDAMTAAQEAREKLTSRLADAEHGYADLAAGRYKDTDE